MDATKLPFDTEAMLAGLKPWVECESPTWDAARVGAMMDVAARDLDLKLPDPPAPEIDTLASYVAHLLGDDAPVPGDAVDVAGFRLTVLDVREGKIRRLYGEKAPAAPEEAEASGI